MAAEKNRSKGRVTKETLRQLALSHSQAMKAQDDQKKVPGTTDRVIGMFDNQLLDLERELMGKFKEWIGLEV